MDIGAIRTALAQVLDTLDVQVYDLAVLSPATLPCVMIYPETISADETYEGKADLTLGLLLLASSVDMGSGQDTLDAWFSTGGTADSIKAAIETDETLGGTVDSAKWAGMVPNSYGIMQLADGGTNYLTARALVDIYA